MACSQRGHNRGFLSTPLKSGEIDVAFFRTRPVDPEGLVITELLKEPMIVAMPSNNPLARRGQANRALPMKALATENFIIYGRRFGHALYSDTITACHAAGFTPRIVQEAARIASTLNLVAAGIGIALVPASLRRVRLDGVAYREIADTKRPTAELGLASRRGDPAVVVKEFTGLVRRTLKEDQSEGDRSPRT
ncbi:MAG: hypothetical protein QOD74_2188 [Variibacter sp.]|nr:hypothetical protein [Variibacter sp.]